MVTERPVRKSIYDPRKNPYPAIDGIEDRFYSVLPVRSDVAAIACMDDIQFEKWYAERKDVAIKLLAQYDLFASIPNLVYSSEEQKLDMNARTHVKEHIKSFIDGLEFLDVIKDFREYAKQEVGSVSEALKRPDIIKKFNERYRKT